MSVTDYAPSKVADDSLPVEDYLRGLGSDPDEVAETLRLMNVTGHITHSTDCPISNALAVAGYGTWTVGVDESVEIIGWAPDQTELPSGGTFDIQVAKYGERVKNPGAIKEFITKFDQDEYPDLVAQDVKVVQP